MAGSVNKVIIIGNLGTDPETKKLENGTTLTRLNIATSETYTDKNSGERKENTEWHRVVLWRKLAEIAEQYLSKGQKVYIEGKLKTRSWEDDQNNMRYTTEIVADNMTMLNTKAEANQMGQQSGGGYGKPEPAQQNNQSPNSGGNSDFATDEEEDDLPF